MKRWALALLMAIPLAVVPASTAAAAGRVRTVVDFDPGWLFNYGDASGASAAAFADGGWRRLSVPHDWSID